MFIAGRVATVAASPVDPLTIEIVVAVVVAVVVVVVAPTTKSAVRAPRDESWLESNPRVAFVVVAAAAAFVAAFVAAFASAPWPLLLPRLAGSQ